MNTNHYYGNIEYDGKKDNYHYIGTQKGITRKIHLYTGEVYGHTIAAQTIQKIINGELENIVGEK